MNLWTTSIFIFRGDIGYHLCKLHTSQAGVDDTAGIQALFAVLYELLHVPGSRTCPCV